MNLKIFNLFFSSKYVIVCSLEVDSDVEVFEMKHEINSLQAKLDEGMIMKEASQLSLVFKPSSMFNVNLDDGTLRRMAGKGWRNSVMQRRIYGR